MLRFLPNRSEPHELPWLARAGRLVILLIPTALLVAASLRASGSKCLVLWLATAFQATICGLSFASRGSGRQALGPSVVTLYFIALAWLWWGDGIDDWFTHLAKAILLVVPLLAFGYQTLVDSGAPAIRRARLLAERLANRVEWPEDVPSCRTLPEVKALREAIHLNAAPALALLSHPRPEVRLAALAALEFRKDWRPGQAEMVLQAAQRAEEPDIRAAGVAALGNLDDRTLVEAVARFMHDASWEVRKAALEALLWDTEHRWAWIRLAVRRVLADPLFLNDGPLVHNGQLLTPEAVKDLTAWCVEKGVVSERSALTLGAHYGKALMDRTDDQLVDSLREQLADPHTAACLRLELGRLLQQHQELNVPLLDKLLDPANPAPLRLIASETILVDHADGSLYASAVAALRDLARLPNREIAMATASIIQRRLGVDLGLGLGQPLPSIHSRQAAEITRRVMVWATQSDVDNVEDTAVSRRA